MNDYISIRVYSDDDERCEKITFPTDTETAKKILKQAGASGDDWFIRYTRAISNNLDNALYRCRNFTEMNYLGALYEELTDLQKAVFAFFSQSKCFENAPVSTFINIILTILNDPKKHPKFYCGNSITIPEKYRIFA